MLKKVNLKFFCFLVILIAVQYFKFFNIFDIYNVASAFNDIKWSGANLFFNDKDIYDIFISGDPYNEILKAQFPNYSITSIYLHLPFGIQSFEGAKFSWSLLTSILICHLYFVFLKGNFNINNKENIIFLSFVLLILSKPFNTILGNGNFSILSFWAFCCFFLEKKKIFSLLIISIKYSFAPIIFIYCILTKKVKEILAVIAITLICGIHFALLFDYNLLELLILPIKIGSLTTASGFFDYQTLLGNHPNNMVLRYFLIVSTSVVFYYFLFKNTNRCYLFDLCLVSIVTLLFYKHLYYDQILLLPILIYSFKLPRKSFLTILTIICYFWLVSYLEFLHPIRYWKSFMIFNNIIFLILSLIIIKYNLKKKFFKKFNF